MKSLCLKQGLLHRGVWKFHRTGYPLPSRGDDKPNRFLGLSEGCLPNTIHMPQNKILPYNPKLKPLARKLRKSMTPGEVLLWQRLRKRALGYQFHRQVPIYEYIVDLFCHELMLAIEIDGKYHKHPEVSVADLERQQELEDLGISFLRFEEMEVRLNVEQTIQTIEGWIALNAL